MRRLPEWIASHDDQAIPTRVRVRVFERYHGACQGCLRKLYPGDKWECDHIVALVNGGAHAEDNLRPLCAWCHKKKTTHDVAEKSRIYKRRKSHLGIRPKSRFACSRDSKFKRKVSGEIVLR